jgi:hypothetical protein
MKSRKPLSTVISMGDESAGSFVVACVWAVYTSSRL